MADIKCFIMYTMSANFVFVPLVILILQTSLTHVDLVLQIF